MKMQNVINTIIAPALNNWDHQLVGTMPITEEYTTAAIFHDLLVMYKDICLECNCKPMSLTGIQLKEIHTISDGENFGDSFGNTEPAYYLYYNATHKVVPFVLVAISNSAGPSLGSITISGDLLRPV